MSCSFCSKCTGSAPFFFFTLQTLCRKSPCLVQISPDLWVSFHGMWQGGYLCMQGNKCYSTSTFIQCHSMSKDLHTVVKM